MGLVTSVAPNVMFSFTSVTLGIDVLTENRAQFMEVEKKVEQSSHHHILFALLISCLNLLTQPNSPQRVTMGHDEQAAAENMAYGPETLSGASSQILLQNCERMQSCQGTARGIAFHTFLLIKTNKSSSLIIL